MDSRFLVCATRSMRNYARSVTDILSRFPSLSGFADNFDGVDALSLMRFADGELEVELSRSIRNKTIFLFASSARNEEGIGSDEAKLELYHAVDALKRAQAKKIIVFEPFVSCSRSDRTTRRNSIGLWVHFKTLVSLGCSHIITFQLHSDKSRTMLDPLSCAIDDIPALPLLKQHLCDVHIQTLEALRQDVRKNWAFCSVDAGGEKLARKCANAFGTALVIAHKQRDYTRANAVESVNILSADSLEDKVLWVVDDMVDTAGSVDTLVRTLVTHRPREINLAIVHPVFSPPASERLARLKSEGYLSRIVASDTICCRSLVTGDHPLAIESVTSRERAARIIYGMVSGRSLSPYFKNFDAEAYLSRGTLFTSGD